MKGMQKNKVFATAKHFPGHGDTSADSHYTLPLISFDRKRLDQIELYPYKKLIKEGLTSVMVAHLSDRKSTRLNSSHVKISYAVFCLKKKKIIFSKQRKATKI